MPFCEFFGTLGTILHFCFSHLNHASKFVKNEQYDANGLSCQFKSQTRIFLKIYFRLDILGNFYIFVIFIHFLVTIFHWEDLKFLRDSEIIIRIYFRIRVT